MKVTFPCPECHAELKAEGKTVGSRVPCPKCGRELTVPATGAGPGAIIGGFLVESFLSRGGMGEVFLAKQLSLDRQVALKILPSAVAKDREAVERFLQEMRLLARLDHPNIVTAYEAGEDGGILFLAMAYVRGESLAARIEREGALPEDESLAMVRKLAGALAYAWNEHKLLHQDIKPANVLLDAGGEPKLADLGLGRRLLERPSGPASEYVWGTPNYMSPEQRDGRDDLDCRADMYSLGVTLYHMITARLPFGKADASKSLELEPSERLPDPRTYNSKLSDPCVLLLERLLARKPEARYGSWEEVAEEAHRVQLGRRPSRAPLSPNQSVMERWRQVESDRHHRKLKVEQDELVRGLRHAAARVERKSGGSKKRVAAIAAGIGILVAALGGVALRARHAEERREREARASAWRVQEGIEAAERARLAEIAKGLEDARNHGKEQPNDFDGRAARLQAAMKQGAGTDVARAAAEEIRKLDGERQRAVDFVRQQLAEQMSAALSAGKYEEAAVALESYAGPFAAETEERRNVWAKQCREESEAARQRGAEEDAHRRAELASRREEARKKLDGLIAAAAGQLLDGNAGAALRPLGEAEQDPGMSPVMEEVRKAQDCVRRCAGVSQALFDSFTRDRGRTVRVEFQNGNAMRAEVAGVIGDQVRLRESVSGGFAERSYPLGAFSAREKFARLESEPPPARNLLRGMVAVEAGLWDTAGQEFAGGDTAVCRALAAAIRGRIAERKELAARQALARLLTMAGIGGDAPSGIEESLLSRPVSALEAGRIRAGVEEFRGKYGATAVAAGSSNVLGALASVGSGASRPQSPLPAPPAPPRPPPEPVALKPGTQEVLDQAVAAWKKANPGLAQVAATVRAERFEIAWGGERKVVRDISALAGLPIAKLDLWAADIRDIDALRGLPLENLNLTETRVSDIAPLRGCPLISLNLHGLPITKLDALKEMTAMRSLNIGDCLVRDIAALQGMDLQNLDMHMTQVSDLSPLCGMSNMTSLVIYGTPVRDLSPLRGLRLQKLNIGGTLVAGLQPLAGMPLTELTLSGAPVRDLSPLADAPLHTLFASGTMISDLSPVGNAALRIVRLDGAPVTDFSPLAGKPIETLSFTYAKGVSARFMDGMPLKDLTITGLNSADDIKDWPETMPKVNALHVLSPTPRKLDQLLRRLPNLAVLEIRGADGHAKGVRGADIAAMRKDHSSKENRPGAGRTKRE